MLYFDDLIADHSYRDADGNVDPQLANAIGPDAAIVHSPDYENALIKIIDGHEDTLTEAEAAAVAVHRIVEEANDGQEQEGAAAAGGAAGASPDTFVKRSNRKRKLQQANEGGGANNGRGRYHNVDWIPPTSTTVERLFSRARLTVGFLRQNLSPSHLNMVLMLLYSRDLFSVSTVDDLSAKEGGDAEDLEASDNESDDEF